MKNNNEEKEFSLYNKNNNYYDNLNGSIYKLDIDNNGKIINNPNKEESNKSDKFIISKKKYLYNLIINNKLIRWLFFLINFIILNINLYCLFEQTKNVLLKKNNNFIKFKNIDLFPLNLISKSFFHISSYLNSKYNNKQLTEIELNIFNGTSNQTKEKKLIRIFEKTTTDPFYTRQIRNLMTEGLENEFIFQFTSDNPDYVVYDTFNCYYLNPKYNDTIKIAFFTENKIPDFFMQIMQLDLTI